MKLEKLTEEDVTKDLNICGYAGKWKKAKEDTESRFPHLSDSAYWVQCRVTFLELGGCYIKEKQDAKDREQMAKHPNLQTGIPIIYTPALNYSIRQG